MKTLPQVLLVAALVTAFAGGVFFLINRSRGPSMEIVLPSPTPNLEIKIYLTGAVKNPGVLTVTDGDRLADVVQLAGGLTAEADQTRVNLAMRVRDQDHWHIPKIGEPVSSPQPAAASISDGKININKATAQQMEWLPEIGPALAQAIVKYREAHGPFASVEDLDRVSGIGPGILSGIRDLVKVQ